jgi:hypothetical protein
MKKRLEKKLAKATVAFYMGAVIQSIAFCWTEFGVDIEDSDDFVKAVLNRDYETAWRIINYYALSFTTNQVVKENAFSEGDMAIPPKKLVDVLKKYVINDDKGANYSIYAPVDVLKYWERRYHDRLVEMAELAEYDEDE